MIFITFEIQFVVEIQLSELTRTFQWPTAVALNEQAQEKAYILKSVPITDNNYHHLFSCFDCASSFIYHLRNSTSI